MTGRTRRGQPLVALGLILAIWVGLRAAVWEAPNLAPVAANPPGLAASQAPVPQPDRAAEPRRETVDRVAADWPVLIARPDAGPAPIDAGRNEAARPHLIAPPVDQPQAPAQPLSPRIAAGHQMLWLAGVSQLPLPPELAQRLATPAAPSPAKPSPVRTSSRWSADGWLLLRPGGNGFNLPGAGLPGANLPSGAYGASQAGAVLRYRLAPNSGHRLALYLRASSALQRPRGEEAALGMSLRPVPRLPVAAMGEVRVTRTLTGNIVRPAAALVTELPPVSLPLGLRGEAYGQAGWVGGKDHTLFVDGQARLERPIANLGKFELRAGAGAWGGAQRGASRIDLGPTATLGVPLGPVNGRLSADWRFRVGGNAAPGSGPALTLSAGF
jgi:hypothetical protein